MATFLKNRWKEKWVSLIVLACGFGSKCPLHFKARLLMSSRLEALSRLLQGQHPKPKGSSQRAPRTTGGLGSVVLQITGRISRQKSFPLLRWSCLEQVWVARAQRENAIRDRQLGSVILIVSLRLSWWLWTHYGLQNQLCRNGPGT